MTNKLPNVISVKTYAVLESVIELGSCSSDELDAYLRSQKFRGHIEVNYSQGGLTNIVCREHIPLTMQQLDSLYHKA